MILNIGAHRLGIRLGAQKCTAGAAPPALTVDLEPLHSIESPDVPRIRKLRRRLLTKRGTRTLVSMVERNDAGMLAILDAYGVVVYWHDGSIRGAQAEGVLDRHVSQFYAPENESVALANNHLCKACASGGSLAAGWHRRPDGSVFWGVTSIEPLLMADGRLQGFVHVTRASNDPRESVVARVQRRWRMRWRTTRLARPASWSCGVASPQFA